VPESLRLDWCRALLDFPTFFPGASRMAWTARIIRSDRATTVHQWAWQADDFHRSGFTASDWYLLRLCVDRRLTKLLEKDDGRLVIDTQRLGYPTIVLIADHWTDWKPLLRSGVSPQRALDLIVDGDRSSWPAARSSTSTAASSCRPEFETAASRRHPAGGGRRSVPERDRELLLQRPDARVRIGQQCLDHDVDDEERFILIARAFGVRASARIVQVEELGHTGYGDLLVGHCCSFD
jgi:hypothetical protein